jgi:hypothetical protein
VSRFLSRESQALDLQEIELAQQTIDENAQRMSGQLGIQMGIQAPKGMCMIVFNVYHCFVSRWAWAKFGSSFPNLTRRLRLNQLKLA